MKLFELCSRAGLECPAGRGDTEILGVTCHSGRVKNGWMFVCIDGTKHKGSEFLEKAYENGAVAVVSEKSLGGDEILCSDVLLAMSRLCRVMYGGDCSRLRLVAVTGTNGKTTIVNLLRSICESSGKKCGTIGTLGIYSGARRLVLSPPDINANMTTPDPEELYPALSQMAADGCEFVFVEASSHALSRKKLDALEFEVGVFTNLSRDHLDFHVDIIDYAAAKARLFGLCKNFIVNADDPNVGLIAPVAIGCSVKGRSDIYADNVRIDGMSGCSYRLNYENQSFLLRSAISGEFTVINTLIAAAVALTLGFTQQDICSGVAAMRSLPGRMEAVSLSLNAPISVYIDYAHTPDALEKLLASARAMAGESRVVLLFGCGGDRDRGKRAEMGSVATRYANHTIITSDNSRNEDPEAIIEEILVGVDKSKNYTVIVDRGDAIEYAIKHSRAGDVIILAGKGHEKYEIDKNGRHEFDEAARVRKAWLER